MCLFQHPNSFEFYQHEIVYEQVGKKLAHFNAVERYSNGSLLSKPNSLLLQH